MATSIETIDNMQTDGPALLQAALIRLGSAGRTHRLVAVIPVYREDDVAGGQLDKLHLLSAPEQVPEDVDALKATGLDAVAAYLMFSGELVESLVEAQHEAAMKKVDEAPAIRVVHHDAVKP